MEELKLGAFIKDRRRELGMTQAALGEKLSVTDKAISRWERGVGFPDIKLLEPLADALEVSIQELMQGQRIEPELPPPDVPEPMPHREPWVRKFCKLAVVPCWLSYTLIHGLAQDPGFAEHLVWVSPLERLSFLVTAAVFLYVSAREVMHG